MVKAKTAFLAAALSGAACARQPVVTATPGLAAIAHTVPAPPPADLVPTKPIAPGDIRACPKIPVDAVSKPRPASAIRWPSSACIARADKLVASMTLQEKIGQMVQPDSKRATSRADIGRLGFGSILSGGSSDPPSGNSPHDWARLVTDFHTDSLSSRLRIPILYGIDGVHGHNNVKGAVIFPHNIGLGASRDIALVEKVARVAAREIAATGIDWTFAPVLAASRDERWGRTYEAFGETPELAESLGAAAIRGFQGDGAPPGDPRVLACAKHFAADGGTFGGKDRGDARFDEPTILAEHIRQYRAAVAANVGSIMVSYSSINGVKMHCNHHLLTEVLKHDMNFDGFLVSDWQAIDEMPGSYTEQVADAINAGLDMIMAPKSYEQFMAVLTSLVPGTVPEARIDDAVRRILSVKCEFGALDPGRWVPDASGKAPLDEKALATIGSPEHREVGREAVRKSLVVLKNERAALPLSKTAPRIHLAGVGADDLGMQCGGWTVTWGGELGPVTTGTTLREGIAKLASGKTRVTYSKDGSGAEGASTAVVVVGETPYAEYKGDRADLSLGEEDLAVLRRVKATGVPVVLVILSGRPLILGPALDLADAIVAAWLPGTEGLGVADVLFGDVAPSGKLSHSWPRQMSDIPINVGDKVYHPLFPFGFGLTYAAGVKGK